MPTCFRAIPHTLRRMLIAEREARAASAAELAAAKAGLVSKTLEIEKLKIQIARLRRQQFGRSSEKIDRVIEQLELMLDELETEAAAGRASRPSPCPRRHREDDPPLRQKSPGRRPLPEHLPRTEIVHQPVRRLPGLRWRDAQGRRGRHRDSRLHPRPLRGNPPRPPGLVLPALREHGADADALACRSSAAGPAPVCSRIFW